MFPIPPLSYFVPPLFYHRHSQSVVTLSSTIRDNTPTIKWLMEIVVSTVSLGLPGHSNDLYISSENKRTCPFPALSIHTRYADDGR